jgi:threonine dehydrogenase-like Zn-dependent dehydrogenase
MFSPGHVIAIDLADTRLEAAKAFGADLTVNNGRADPVSFVREVTEGLGAARFVTHRFALADILQAYDVFARAADTGAIKVVMTRG